MPTSAQFRGRFFSRVNYSAMIKVIAENKSLILELIEQIQLFKKSFEAQLKQPSTDKETRELKAALHRSEQRLDTLEKLKADQPVTKEEQKLLVDYIKTMHISGAKTFTELHKETDLHEEQSQPALK